MAGRPQCLRQEVHCAIGILIVPERMLDHLRGACAYCANLCRALPAVRGIRSAFKRSAQFTPANRRLGLVGLFDGLVR